MLEFIKKAYHRYMNTILLINQSLFMVLGGVLGDLLSGNKNQMFYMILGLIIGTLIGLLLNIIFGGFIATIINIDKNLEIIKGSKSENNNTLSEE